MEKRQDKFYLYLVWPKYLAQWFAHEMYRLERFQEEVEPPYMYNCNVEVEKLEPVLTRRGSAERNILEMCLQKQPDVVPELAPRDATICIEIPCFVNKPPMYYNYLGPSGRELLLETVRNRFRVELIRYMNKVMFEKYHTDGKKVSNEQKVATFLDINGIEYNDTNVESVKMLWRRLWKYQYQKNNRNENTGN